MRIRHSHDAFSIRMAAIAILAAIAGCGTGDRVAVRGRVLLDGQPVPGAYVDFHAEPSVTRGNGGFGVCDASGSFRMRTRQGRDGIFPGEYRVTVSRVEVAPAARRTAAEIEALTLDERTAYEQQLDSDPNLTRELFPRYAHAATTPLAMTVGPGQEPLNLDLVSSPGGNR